MARSHLTCDGPGCCARRTRWQALCDRCFAQLPASVSAKLIRARSERSWNPAGYRTARREATRCLVEQGRRRAHHALARTISPERAAALTARVLGEREETADA